MLQIGQKRREKWLGFGERKSRVTLLVAMLGGSRGTGTWAGTARSSHCPHGVPVGSQPGAVPPCDPSRCVLNPPTGCPQPWEPGCGTEGCPMSPPQVSPSPGVPPAPTPHQGHAVAAATGTRDMGRSPPMQASPNHSPGAGGTQSQCRGHLCVPSPCSSHPPPGCHRAGWTADGRHLRGCPGPPGCEAVAQVTSPAGTGWGQGPCWGGSGNSSLSSLPE